MRNRGGEGTGIVMKTFVVAGLTLLGTCGAALATSAFNKDSEPRTLIVTENGTRSELTLAPGETVEFCSSGCFVTMPNGDRLALTGSEDVEISGGGGRVR